MSGLAREGSGSPTARRTGGAHHRLLPADPAAPCDADALLADVVGCFADFQERARARLALLRDERRSVEDGRRTFDDAQAAKRRRLGLDSACGGPALPSPRRCCVAAPTLVVGGVEFAVPLSVLQALPNTLFTLLLECPGGGLQLRYVLDRDPQLFSVVLEYLTSVAASGGAAGASPVAGGALKGLAGISKIEAANVAREAGFYGLPGLRRLAINCTALLVSTDQDTPYNTIASAVAAAVNGDRILVLPGVYKECIFTTKRIEISGDGPREDVVLCTKEDHPTIVFSGSGGGVLRGLTLREDSPFGVALVEGKGSSSVVIDGCDLSTNCCGNAINIVDEASLYLVKCGIHDVKGSGVFLRDNATATIRSNTFVNVDSCGLFTRHKTRFYFEGNTIQKAALGGIDINDLSLGTIDGNTITECGRGGIVFYGSSHTRVKGNTITHNEYGMRSFESSVQILNHNTVRDNHIANMQGTGIRRATLESGASGVDDDGDAP